MQPLPTTAPARVAGGASLADLTACVRRTLGDRPPPLVGCSLTLIDDTVYVFGGRLVPTRTMVNSLYALSLHTLTWTLLWPSPSSSSSTAGPAPRYFHSAEAWGSKVIVFGGEGYLPNERETDDPTPLCTLDDVCIWDTEKGVWEVPELGCAEGVERPAARYAHLAVVQRWGQEKGLVESGVERERSVMVIIGGQDVRNTYLHSVNVLDLEEMKWVRVGKWEKHIGTYRAVVTSAKQTVVPGGRTPSVAAALAGGRPRGGSLSNGATNGTGEKSEDTMGLAQGESLVQLSYSERPTVDRPEPLLLFSNFNFTAVRRDLDVLTAPVPPSHPLDVSSLSALMTGPALPPGLRFPTGTIVGHHLLIFGTFLSQAVNNFSIWALDLGKGGGAGLIDSAKEGEMLPWSRVDPGSILSRGSWNRALAWKNSVVVLGDRERDIATDYDHRQTNFAHIAFVDLEAFGIYQPPPRRLPLLAQSFGLLTLSQSFLADFEIVCSDGRRLGCSRKLLDDRWPWFTNKMDEFKLRAKGILAVQQKRFDAQTEELNPDTMAQEVQTPTLVPRSPTDLRLTPRTLNLPETSAIAQAFLQYLYTLTLCTPHQLSLPVLTGLLIFAKTYDVGNLRALVVHALHEALGSGQWNAAAVYEAATFGGCHALQIRALKLMMTGPRPNLNRLRSNTRNEPPLEPGRQTLAASS